MGQFLNWGWVAKVIETKPKYILDLGLVFVFGEPNLSLQHPNGRLWSASMQAEQLIEDFRVVSQELVVERWPCNRLLAICIVRLYFTSEQLL